MVQPDSCAVPPGFFVKGNISNKFDTWKIVGIPQHTSSYSEGWIGFSNRWQNDKIKSKNVVAGFQFRISSGDAKRWRRKPAIGNNIQWEYQEREHGGVHLKFPRVHLMQDVNSNYALNGVYMLSIRWFVDMHISEGRVGKEYPHPTTKGYNFKEFGSEPDPRPNIGHVGDGNWHTFVAAVWNQGDIPIMALWYNPDPNYEWKNFEFLGYAGDRPENVISPGPRFLLGIEEVPLGVTPVGHKHDIEIRIDDIPTDQIEIRNMFAANVSLYVEDPLSNESKNLQIKILLRKKGVFGTVSIRAVAEQMRITTTISVRHIFERLQKNIF